MDGYCFAAQEISENPASSRSYVRLTISPADDKSLQHLEQVWQRLTQAVINHHTLSADNTNCPAWTRWKFSKWSKEHIDDKDRFVAWEGDALVAFLNVRRNIPSSQPNTGPILYIEHVMSIPGCLPTRIWNRRLRGVAEPLLAFSILHSQKNGHDGRIGLHAADSRAEGLYDHLNGEFDGKLFSIRRTGVRTLYNNDESKTYFEASAEGASRLLEVFRHDN